MEKIFLGEDEMFEVHFDYIAGSPRTFDYPGEDDEVDIECITLLGKSISKEAENELISHFGKEHIENLCYEKVQELKRDYRIDEADYRYHQMKDDGMVA